MYAESAVISVESSPDLASSAPVIFVVDDDVSVRESLEGLLESAGWQPITFASAEEFLAHPRVVVCVPSTMGPAWGLLP